MSLSDGVYRSFASVHTDGDRDRAADIFAAAMRFAVTKASLKDLSRAKFLLDSGGKAAAPLAAATSVRDTLLRLQAAPGAALWLASLLEKDAAAALVDSAWYGKSVAAPQALPQADAGITPPVPLPFVVEHVRFVRSGGVIIAENEVSEAGFAAFLQANPEWNRSNAGALTEQGLAGDDYLMQVTNPGFPTGTQAGVSWFAAAAYCEWLTSRLPAALRARFEVRLPSEAEWEAAATAAAAYGSLVNIAGGCWEWCADYYAPLNLFPAADWAVAQVGSPYRSVRGGSWANAPGAVTPQTRGSLTPRSCSSFVSFRPLLAPINGGSDDRR
jgi:formylglycine-generating enzyme required for sulfatase activity